LAQSLFQVGGNGGSALGPLLAAFVLTKGQGSVAWLSLLALAGIIILTRIGSWAKKHRLTKHAVPRIPGSDPGKSAEHLPAMTRRKLTISMAVLIALMFSKFFYLASITSYYTFYLINKFHVTVQSAQLHLFLFLGAVAAGTILGGPVGDRLGRKYVIWWSILGVLPFTLMLPYANLWWTSILSIVIGVILASAFPAILVYGQELVPGRVGTISGLFFGLCFWHGRCWSGATREARGSYFHQCCLPCVCIPSSDRNSYSFPTRSGAREPGGPRISDKVSFYREWNFGPMRFL
jgi:FSR family fosmidomycin resistance protein-like MFS transporter